MIHLHTHSQYSTLDGLSTVEEIVARAKELKAPAVAITDHASISCLPLFMKTAKEAGVKPIIGCEFYTVDQYEPDTVKDKDRLHLSVWAKNWNGVKSIMKMLTLANKQFFRRPLIDFNQALDFEDCIIGSACSFGILRHDNWATYAEKLHDTYSNDLYLEIMPHVVDLGDGVDIQRLVNERAVSLHKSLGVNLLATNDSHYTLKEDATTHTLLMVTQYNKKLSEHKAWPSVFFMRTMVEMKTAFEGLGYIKFEYMLNAMENTISLQEKVDIVKPEIEITLPSLHEDDNAYLINRVLEGWKRKIKNKVGKRSPEYRKRLSYELEVIKKMGFVRYFIMVEDVISWARSQDIMVGPARGSAAGSLVCYLMDITQVDPIRFGLYFERFLNPERADLPDIDVDFQDNRREEVFNYVVSKYGREKVGQINTFTSMALKSAFRDVCRAYGVDMFRVNNLSVQIEDEESFSKVPDLAGFKKVNPELVEHILKLNGAIRGNGVHACGVCISDTPLEQTCVMERRKGNVFVSNWDKRDCEDFGLLKMDLLGLTTLSILEMCGKLVKKHYDIDIDFENPDLTDVKTLSAFAAGDCAGIFQFESQGMQELLKSLGAKDFETLVATTALYRPGPLNSGLTDRYVKIARGDEYPYYPHPALEPVLKETHSVIVYQEQIMRTFNELAGFTWAEADKMRKIIGKKLGDAAFEVHRSHFVEGCLRNGVPEEVSGGLFDQMKEFAAYSFNKSHAVAYTMISFWSMYMKVNYPALFLTSYMTCVHQEDTVLIAMREAKRLGVPVLAPDINSSTGQYEYDHEDGSIIAPLNAVKGVGGKAVAVILAAREKGIFLSVDDMDKKLDNRRSCHKGIIEKLKLAGAFETLGIREADPELREKQMAELLPAFDTTPVLSINRDKRLSKVALTELAGEIERYGSTADLKPLAPLHGAAPVMMIINNQVKGESKLGTAKGVTPMFGRLKRMGIGRTQIYYTSVIKYYLDNPRAPKRDIQKLSTDWLKKEIKAVGPKLVYCCTADAVNTFQPGGKISKLYGCIKYHKDFDCYVLFGPSPQFAGFRPEDVGVMYERCLQKIAEMFDGVKYDK
jgi:DNA polymerase-3 subunit alpha